MSSVDENGIRRLQVFVSPFKHLIYEDDCCVTGFYLWYTDSLGAHWAARGLPQPQWSGSLMPDVLRVDAITYRSRNGYQWFHAFGLLYVGSGNDYLVRHYWGGSPVSLPSWAGQGPLP